MKAFFMERLSKELNLTEDQKVTIGKFVEQMEEKRRDYFLQKKAETEKLINQMKKELTPDQQKRLGAKFDSLSWHFWFVSISPNCQNADN